MSYFKKEELEALYVYMTDQCFSEEDGIKSLIKVQAYIYEFLEKHINLDPFVDKYEKGGYEDE